MRLPLTQAESEEALTNEDTILHAEAALPSNCINKSQTRAYTKRIAYHLRNSFGIGKNGPGKDVVVCISSGQVLLPTIFYAVIAAGGVYSAASSSFTSLELARQVKQGKSRLIIASSNCQDVAVKAASECGVPLDRVLILESMGGQRKLQSVTGNGRNFIQGEAKSGESLDWEVIKDKKRLEESVICLLYSSGTTGVPKGEHSSTIRRIVLVGGERAFIIRETNVVLQGSFCPTPTSSPKD